MKRLNLAKEMLLTAEEFRRAGIVLEGDQSKGLSLDPHVAIPMTVCHAFCGEMYLKFLICIRTTREVPAIHNLDHLFHRHLPKDVRPTIKKNWENPIPIDLSIRAALNAHFGRKPRTYEESLAESANALTEFRYHYESRTIRTFDATLVNAFRATVFELYPTEFADVRLPLPPGALPAHMQNVVTHGVRNPATDWSEK